MRHSGRAYGTPLEEIFQMLFSFRAEFGVVLAMAAHRTIRWGSVICSKCFSAPAGAGGKGQVGHVGRNFLIFDTSRIQIKLRLISSRNALK